jgi:deazaflavin-dependent oxidoreductase (nitroreductase family)
MSQQRSGFVHFIPYPRGILHTLVRLPMLLQKFGAGWLLRPMNLMILTTRGRKSSLSRHVVLEYRRHGSKLYVISGWGKQPHWFRNLTANPDVTLQLGQAEIAASACLVKDSAEALRALYMFQRTGPIYEAILADMSSADSIDLRTLKQVADEFTVVRFDLLEDAPPLMGIEIVNRWIAPVIFATSLLYLLWMLWSRFPDNDESFG